MGLSISKALIHALKAPFRGKGTVGQKDTETSLIERFMYPKLGRGQLWEEFAKIVEEQGGEINFNKVLIIWLQEIDVKRISGKLILKRIITKRADRRAVQS